MPRLSDLLNRPSPNMSADDQFKFNTSVWDVLEGLFAVSNTSETTNANFVTLSAQGTTPTTEADGDDFEFIQDWFVVGSTVADYSLTATLYPDNSEVQSASDYYVNVVVTDYDGSGLYFYQKQDNSVRKYQNQLITVTINANNNQSSKIKLRMNMFVNYGTTSELIEGRPFYLEPGLNNLYTTLEIPSLRGKTVTGANYIELRLDFAELYDGTADFDLYLIKSEFGKISTSLNT